MRAVPPAAGPVISDWRGVEALPEGALLRVDLSDGTTISGRLVAVSLDELVLREDGATRHIPRSAVRRVIRLHRRTAEKARWGAVMGAALSVATSAAGRTRPTFALCIAPAWAAAGAVIGATDGVRDWRQALVYERGAAPPSRREGATLRSERSDRDTPGVY